jgi:hypothetical protein
MKLLLKNIITSLIALLTIFSLTNNASAAGVYQNFDALPVTGENEIPGDGGGWKYTSHITNTYDSFYGSCGWWNTTTYPEHPGTIEYFKLYKNSYNNPHMGYESFAFLEIDDTNSISGHSLKATIVGGKKDNGNGGVETHGLPLFTKEEYLSYINNGQDPVDSELVGNARLYLMNSSYNNGNYPIPAAVGANKLSYYVFLPQGLSNVSGSKNWPAKTFDSAPFNHIGGHWYNDGYLNGGGWAHVIVDTHPQHNNSWSSADEYPYPSYSLRAYDESFFNSLYAIYLSIGMYSGTAYPKYSIWFDEIKFVNDPYYTQQNNETINSPSVMLHVDEKIFEMGWSGKYKNFGESKATYEVRYSFSQISNDSWVNAIPVHVQEHHQFNITANTQGIVKKPHNYRQPVWLSFKLRPKDENKLVPGTTICFAIKDISQNPNNLQVPNPAHHHGRDYANHMNSFDFEGDAPVLPLIKRIDYYISSSDEGPPPQQTKPVIQSIQIK